VSDQPHIFADPELARGIELTPVQVWRDPATQNVIIQIEPGREQAVFTPAQWRRTVKFLDGQPDSEGVDDAAASS